MTKKKWIISITAVGLAIVIATTIILAIVFSKKKDDSLSSSSAPQTQESVIPTIDEPFVPTKLVSNGERLNSYKIVHSASATAPEKYAAQELHDYIQKATNVDIPIINDGMEKVGNEIVIGQTTRAICQGVDYSALGIEGYAMKSEGKDLLLAANDQRGSLYVVYTYLEKLGFRFYTQDIEKVPTDSEVFVAKDLNETYVPTIAYRDTMYKAAWNPVRATRLKINGAFARTELMKEKKYGGTVRYAYGDRGMVHTIRYLLPENLLTSHPEYFALYQGVRQAGQWGNACFTSEGALETVKANALSWVASDPTVDYISISQNDGLCYCQCENCEASYQTYGKTGTVLKFVNQVAEAIGEKYPQVKVEFISYGLTSELPKGGIKPVDNIMVRVCLAHCLTHLTNDCECEELEAAKERINGWKAISKEIQCYAYLSNYSNFMSVFPILNTLYDAMQIFINAGIQGAYLEGVGAFSGEFDDLRIYLLSKILWNPMMTRAEFDYHLNDFLAEYYGDGWNYVREYIDYNEEIAIKYAREKDELGVLENHRFSGEDINFFPIYDNETDTYDLTIFEEWNDLWDKAENLADENEIKRVQYSRIAPTYFELYYTMSYQYKDKSKRENLVERNQNLYETMIENKVMQKGDHIYIKENIKDFVLPPKHWQETRS